MRIKGLSQKRGWYYYQPPQIDGIRPKRIALKTKDERKAIEAALELRDRSIRHTGQDRLSGHVDRFMQAKQASGTYTAKTAQATENCLKLFCEWAGNPTIGDVTRGMIERWRDQLLAEGRARSGVVTYMRRVQSLFSWLVSEDRLVANPFDKVAVPKVRRSQAITFCTKAQRDQLIENCPREDLLFCLMAGFFLGLRKIEIIEARPEWFITPGLCQVTATDSFLPKDKERRTIRCSPRFQRFLEDYGLRSPFMLRPEVKRKKSLYRFEPRRPWDDYMEEQGMRWVTMHVMRHTFATLHIQGGTPLATVAQELGDSHEVTFNNYAAYAPRDNHADTLD